MKFVSIILMAFAVYGIYCFLKNIIRVCRELKMKNIKVVKDETENEHK